MKPRSSSHSYDDCYAPGYIAFYLCPNSGFKLTNLQID
jgi:hypothetical protein